jgi:hypothetical protein
VICADVIEHLVDPDPALGLLCRAAGENGWILISTPERHRLRGRRAMACTKPDHVREWSRGEFVQYLRASGLGVVQSRLMPQDDAPMARCLSREAMFMARASARSPLACHAVLCRPSPRGGM